MRLYSSFWSLDVESQHLQRARRIWLTDRQLSFIALDLRDDLGSWIKRRMKRGVEEQGRRANQVLSTITASKDELRGQWDLQKAAQMSVRARELHFLPY